MKQTLLSSLFIAISTSLYAQVGIGVTEPKAYLNVLEGKTVLFGADTVGVQGDGERLSPKMIWYASNGAFRAGGISNDASSYNYWDRANVGDYSFASGLNTKASGFASTAIGINTTASANYSTAMGFYTIASGGRSTAMGHYTIAQGLRSTAMGDFTNASGISSTAMGRGTAASGDNSTAMGYLTTASGALSTAMGAGTTASGDNSTAMGTRNTAAYDGSFIIGDVNEYDYNTTADNQLMMHFQGGYLFYTGNGPQDATFGVELQPYANAWSVVSDSTRKENFRATDGALFLKKISGMRLGSWNYKGQNVKQYRHYGPMAQDFFAAFGRDELGLIGEEKSINQADFDGVNLIAIQALIKEVEALKAENANLKQANASTKTETESLKVKMQQFEKQLSVFMTSGTTSTISK